MKYLKIYEDFNFKKYIGKYVILEYNDKLWIAKIIKLATNEHYVHMEYYEWDDFYKGYNVNHMRLRINEFIILESFDNIKDAEKELEKFQERKKI